MKSHFKHWIIIVAFCLCMWADRLLENYRRELRRADPISGTMVLLSIGLSLASTGASLIINRSLAAKPTQRILGKMSGDIQASDSVFGVEKNEIYGARPDPDGTEDDRLGGVLVGLNYFWLAKNEIREHRTTVEGSGGGRGKGPPDPPPDVRISYDCDIAGLVGKGPLRVFQIRFNQDTVVDATHPRGEAAVNRSYEAESAALSFGASAVADAGASGGERVDLPAGEYVRFETVRGVGTSDDHEIVVLFRASGGGELTVTVNGAAEPPVTLPAYSLFTMAVVNAPLALGATNTIQVTNSGGTTISVDRIAVTTPLEFDDGDGVTGVLDTFMPRAKAYDTIFLPDPLEADPLPHLRASLQPVTDEDGVTFFDPAGDACQSIVVYPGTETQPIDPDIQADIDSREEYGPGYTPAFLGDCYVKIMGLNVSKYRGIPNVRVAAEHQTLTTLNQILEHRALRVAGDLITGADLDFSEAEGVPVRGFIVSRSQAPKADMTTLGQWYNFAFYEDIDGKIKARDLSRRDIDFELTIHDLGAHVTSGEGSSAADVVDVETKSEDSTKGWRSLDVGHINPRRDWEATSQLAQREATTSERHETIEFPITATDEEGLAVSKRLLQKHELELDPHFVTVNSEWLWLTPTMRGVVPVDGTNQVMRIAETQGAYPGVLRLSLVADGLSVIAGDPLASARTPRVRFASSSLATFIDIPVIHPQALPGVYIAVCPRPTRGNSFWNGATAFRKVEGEQQRMTTFDTPCTMGRVVGGALPDVPGGWAEGDWDDTNTFTIDLAYGTPPTFTDAEILAGLGVWVVGSELCGVGTWTRDNSKPNRWVGSHLQRKLKKTSSADHAEGERVALMNSAVRFVELATSEQNVPRVWTIVSNGERITEAAELDFTWVGNSIRRSAVYDGIDAGVPVVTLAPTVTLSDNSQDWIIYTPRPDALGFSLTDVQVRFRRLDDETHVRTVNNDLNTTLWQQQFAFDCLVDYRWRNRFRAGVPPAASAAEDGWSAWSPTAEAYGIGSLSTNDSNNSITTFDIDAGDVYNPNERDVLIEL